MEHIKRAISDYSILMRILDSQLGESLTKKRIANLKQTLGKAQQELAATIGTQLKNQAD